MTRFRRLSLAGQRGPALHRARGRACRELVAARRNPVIRAFYQRLIAAGKQPLVALIASMRKLLIICNAIVASQQPWNPDIKPAAS